MEPLRISEHRINRKAAKTGWNKTIGTHWNMAEPFTPHIRSAVETSRVTPEPAEPEEVIKTLEDYLAEKAAKSARISLPEARAANSGTDDSQWKNAKVLEVQEAEDFIKIGKESVAKSRKGKKETKVLIKDLEFNFAEPARDPAPRSAFRGGRGGDRGARGSRGSGPRRGGPPSRGGGDDVNVDDQELFPSLGSQ